MVVHVLHPFAIFYHISWACHLLSICYKYLYFTLERYWKLTKLCFIQIQNNMTEPIDAKFVFLLSNI